MYQSPSPGIYFFLFAKPCDEERTISNTEKSTNMFVILAIERKI